MQNNDRIRSVKDIYEKLLSRFGAQGWWPVYSDGGPGYHPGDFSYPRTETQRTEIVFGAILTQQSSWKNAEKALFALMGMDLLDLKRIADIDIGVLQKLIRPSGYFRQKSLRLKDFSCFVLENYGGLEELLYLDMKNLRKELLSVKGIGNETADSIMLYAAKKPKFVVDAYTFRIAGRLGLIEDWDYDALQRLFEGGLPERHETYNEFHALLVELGKRHCGKRPNCGGCPLKEMCPYNKKT